MHELDRGGSGTGGLCLRSPHFLPPFRLERWFVEFEFVPGIRNLTASGPYDATTQELLALEDEGTIERYLHLGLGYIENPGSQSLRQAVSSLYTTLQAEDIQITSGASEALFLLTWSLVEPGANIVIEDPCYENLPGVASVLSFEVHGLPLHIEESWKLNLEQLAQLIEEKTRLIYLVHPYNPTGSTLQVEEMRAIARMAERVGALVVNRMLMRIPIMGCFFYGFHNFEPGFKLENDDRHSCTSGSTTSKPVRAMSL